MTAESSGGGWRLALRYALLGLTCTGLSLLGLRLLLGQQLARQQRHQLVSGVSANLLLAAAALERFSPQALEQLSGMQLAVGPRPPRGRDPGWPPIDGRQLQRQAALLRSELCQRLTPCPEVLPAQGAPRGLWLPIDSPLEQVWLFVPLPAAGAWPPDPGLLSLALGIGGLSTGLLFQLQEVQRPLRRLEQALAEVGVAETDSPVPERGSGAVRRLSRRFNAMVERLAANERERRTMLAGIAHDLRAPLTRLRLRLQLRDPGATAHAWTGGSAGADLDALERITGQFLLFAGAEADEAPLRLPLQELLAETAAQVGELPLSLDLTPLERRVRPIGLGRAVANLLENAADHGRPPLRLVLRPWSPNEDGPRARAEGFEIQVWDSGAGISAADWPRALTPFLRLDAARGGGGHSGLGLAIAERIAIAHGGGLERLTDASGFAVVLRGRSLPPD